MRRRLLISAMAILMAMIPQMVSALTYGDFEYVVSGGKVTITAYKGSAAAVSVPEEIDGQTVAAIGDKAFEYCEDIVSVELPDSLETIGSSAFDGCVKLKSAALPGKLKTIGSRAFHECVSLESVAVPRSVSSIGEEAFMWCNSLSGVTVDSQNADYASENGILFDKDKKTLIFCPPGFKETSYAIPSGVTKIERRAFHNCGSLKSISVPESITEIGDNAFALCTALESMTLQGEFNMLAQNTFSMCFSLKTVEIPPGVLFIQEETFSYCNSLEAVYLPDSAYCESDAFPNTASVVMYAVDDTDGLPKACITGVTLGTGKTSAPIPETICGMKVDSADSGDGDDDGESEELPDDSDSDADNNDSDSYGDTDEDAAGSDSEETAGERAKGLIQTGDSTSLTVWAALMILSIAGAAGFAAAASIRRRRM